MGEVTNRAVHFVGSFPADDTETAMRAMLDSSGERLRTLPTGETRRYEFYVMPIIDDLVAQGVLEVRKTGSWASSGQRALHRLAGGEPLTGERMDLGYLREATEARPIFTALRAERTLPRLSLQIGMPTDLTLTFVALGVTGLRAHRQAFADAALRDIVAIRELAGDDVVIQLEATAELVLLAKTQPLHRITERALGLGKHMAELAARAPAGTRFGVHLCLGSLHNQARAALRDTRPLVELANSIAQQWPAERPLEYVHGPIAAGHRPPPTNDSFYAPLADLALGGHTSFYAGLAHDAPTEVEQLRTLDTIENALGRRVDGVAAACGLGRVPRATADLLMTRANALAAAS